MKLTTRMYRHEAAVLEAILRNDAPARRCLLPDVSGYAQPTVDRALHILTSAGAIRRVFHGHFMVTDRGKIALALWQGQQQRKRALAASATCGIPQAPLTSAML